MGRIDLTREIKAAFNEQRKQIEKAEIIALNRAGKSALAQTVIFIRKAYNIKSSDLKNEIKISRATKGAKRFRLTVTHKGLALFKFGSPNKTSKGARITVKRGKRETYKGAFITNVMGTKSKKIHTGIFKREGKDRLPIKELYGPSAMQLMSSDEAQRYIEKIFMDKFDIELKRAMQYAK